MHSRMGERKRNGNIPALDSNALASSSAVRGGANNPAYPHQQQRSPSPPASAYFPLLSAGNTQSTPNAQAHFAYSTTLRRHNVDNLTLPSPAVLAKKARVSLWTRFVAAFTGRQPVPTEDPDADSHLESARLPSAKPENEDRRDTISAKFAHTSVEDTISYYRTSPTQGLLKSDIPGLLEKHGYNEFSVSAPEPLLLKFAKTIYESPLILLLCGSATISAIMGNIDDAVSITVAVLIVLTVGFIQERRSEKSLEALNKLVPHHCHVIRQGETIHVLANELVPGDLVSFKTGDRIPADIRVIQAVELEVDESSLTGETETRKKSDKTCVLQPRRGGQPGHEPVALADRSNIVYMGTLVRNGYGSGIVIATGAQTEFGLIFSLMSEVEETRTPLQLSMDDLAKKLSFTSFGVIGVICLIGWIQGRGWLEMFTIGVSLAVAAIPEGLPIVTTVTLALGVLRMAKRKAIVKKLHSVEGLGSVSVICSDKTGTLTKNEQTVVEAYVVDETINLDPAATNTRMSLSLSSAFRKMFDIGAICNNASLQRNEEGVFVGQSTDVALINVLDVVGVQDRREGFKRLSERPFSSELKFMAVSGVHLPGANPNSSHPQQESSGGREMYYTKGSIEAILDRCKFYYVNDESTPGLDPNTRSVILGKANEAARRGLRVLAVAYGYGAVETSSSGSGLSRGTSPVPGSNSPGGAPGVGEVREKTNLVFVGFQAMLDPPRKGVADSIALLQSGGVDVVMITGDAEETALSIARKLGLKVGAAPSRHPPSLGGAPGGSPVRDRFEGDRSYCLTGSAIDQMSKAQLKERVGSVSVFARTTPRHKMKIVEALQARGMVVAMTGDGVNDAPALKLSDIGISMGKSGTDVAKEAADVILVDDNFSTILPAIEEGKSIFHNIQNFLAFQLSTAAAALTLITLSTFLGLSNPLNAMQILFINILMDGPPSQSLGVDPVDPAIMRKPPRKKDAPILTKRLLYRVLFSASIIVIGTLFVYVFALADDDTMSRREQTMTFSCFVFLDLVSAVQNRGLGCGIVQNRMLVGTVGTSALVQIALVYVPFMQRIFQTEGLDLSDLGILFGLAGLSFCLHEARRRFERRSLGGVSGGYAGGEGGSYVAVATEEMA